MGLYRRILIWFGWCIIITASVNLIWANCSISKQQQIKQNVPSPSESVEYHSTNKPQVFLQGEVYAIRDSEYHRKKDKLRPGLKRIEDLYKYLLTTSAQFSEPSPLVWELVKYLKKDVTKRWVTDDPWDVARKWANPKSLLPNPAKGLGDILAAMNGAPILATDVGYKGTQLKVMMLLKGGQRVVFKPQWYSRDEVIEGEVYAGADRHNGEIVAFHLSRLLGLGMVPLAVGRRVDLRKEILKKSSRKLAKTFYVKDRKTCFYGVCYYCRKESSVCDDGRHLEGVVIMWLPKKLSLLHLPHPWARTYKKGKLAIWEEYSDYCEHVKRNSLFAEDKSSRLLDLMDVAVFDFLQQNGDRHHYTVVKDHPDSDIILLDNGKSFGDPYVDHLDILAPILQCCRLRQKTYERLVLLSGGGLSEGLAELIKTDPMAPLLSPAHLKALDRRIHHILAVMKSCKEQKGSWHHILY